MVTKVKRSKSPSEMRTGYTTGACAAAAACAATRLLLGAVHFKDIEIVLPNRDNARFTLHKLEMAAKTAIASVIKDAGDDPDCTHGAEIIASVSFSQSQDINIDGGEGVAKVTLPGLELPVGFAAINPVPRRNITDMVKREMDEVGYHGGLDVLISVPQGQEMAKQTIGERLGLIGGISILGTRGTVKPYSTSAYASSVKQTIQIAKQNGQQHAVLTTGTRSEQSAIAMFPQLASLCFVQAGDFIGVGLRAAKRYQLERVTIVAMIGKLGKLVAGHMMTHVSGKAIDFTLLADIATQTGCDHEFIQAVSQANTGRHVLDLWKQNPTSNYLVALCRHAQNHAQNYIDHQLEVEVRLIDFDGKLLASSSMT
ncbi:cobalt-precorrin-5B (C(1))-methyltransferase [Vibrio sp. SCSIO 43136]|uniref:cobalt-precorrin-5B (C(1))-methyltransferase n=1 Tax=Vibrio sp. SCSIO 43136 TaxID=2819101 RepID=UPI0020759923|nr:cobalt-precorrin-5B (C(1))-methyltransferase [Vibrio sp. SCSIO 43136]